MLLQLPGKSGANKQQDQFAYNKMVEFLIQYARADKELHPLLMCVMTLMHKHFLNQKQQEGVIAGLKNFVTQVELPHFFQHFGLPRNTEIDDELHAYL